MKARQALTLLAMCGALYACTAVPAFTQEKTVIVLTLTDSQTGDKINMSCTPINITDDNGDVVPDYRKFNP